MPLIQGIQIKISEKQVGRVHGGLGIRNLKDHSKALKMKWLWRYSQEPQALWGNVIKAKYGEEDNWTTKEVNTAYGVSLWRSIRSLWPILKNNSSIKVQDGNKTSFWKDNWLGDGCLKDLFPICLFWHNINITLWLKCGPLKDGHLFLEEA